MSLRRLLSIAKPKKKGNLAPMEYLYFIETCVLVHSIHSALLSLTGSLVHRLAAPGHDQLVNVLFDAWMITIGDSRLIDLSWLDDHKVRVPSVQSCIVAYFLYMPSSSRRASTAP